MYGSAGLVDAAAMVASLPENEMGALSPLASK
jgi:hypothetical protein